jgi:hypothetical protein
MALRSIGGWTLVALGAVAFGPASAQVETRAPSPRLTQYQPPPPRTYVPAPAPRVIYPSQTYAQPVYAAPTGFAAYK